MKKIYLIIGLVFGLQGFASAQYACGDAFLDSGGAAGDYAVDESDTIVFCPANVGEAAQLVFSAFELEEPGFTVYDYLSFYDGADVNAPLIGSYTGTDNPGTITAENAGGCLTVVFVSDIIVPAAGWEAVFNCVPAPTCLRPSDLVSSATTDVSTTLGWTANTGETSWNIEYGPAGFAQGTGMFVNVTTNPYILSGLTGLTEYDVYIKALCSANDSSSTTGPITFVTTATPLFCGDSFFDSGTDAAEYANNENYTQVLCPNNPATETVQLTFTLFDTEEDFDFLTIYDGNDVTGSEIGSYSGSALPPTIIAENPTGCLTINFDSDNSVSDTGWVASVTCVAPITCFRPADLVSTAVTDETSTLSWTSNGTETEWIIEYGEAGFAQGAGTTITVNTNPYTITGLIQLTDYEVYIQASCGAETSTVEGPTAFSTVVTPLAPFICGNMFTDANGTVGEYVNNTTDTITICPTDAATQTIQLVFTAFDTEEGYDFLTIYDGNDLTATELGSYSGLASPGTIVAENSTGCLTVLFDSDGSTVGAGWEAAINCVTPVTCLRPTDIVENAVTDLTATLSWTANGTETEWSIEYGPTGFALGTGTTATTTTNPHTISGLTELTNYDFYVSASCGGGDMSSVTGPFAFSTTQTPLAPFICGNLFTDAGGVNSNYSNGTNDTIVICPSGANQAVSLVFTEFSVEPMSATGTVYDSLTIYDGNDVSGAMLGSYTGTDSPGTVLATNATGCLTVVFISDGSVSDLGWSASIECITTVVCDAPTNLGSSASSETTATLTWTNGGAETAWSIEYGPVGFTQGNGTVVSATTNPFTLTGLTAGTNYEYYIQAFCSAVDFSLIAGPATFSTSTISVEELNANSLSIQPNPTKGKVVIKNLTNVSVAGELFDAQGRSLNINSTINANSEISLDINNFENGVYFFKTTSELGNKTFSIVKN
jgi:hypothetical protein